jgi:hypothetical protein
MKSRTLTMTIFNPLLGSNNEICLWPIIVNNDFGIVVMMNNHHNTYFTQTSLNERSSLELELTK